jgi:hypothetical protein
MKKCSWCGRENGDDAPHCQECGTAFKVLPADSPEGMSENYFSCIRRFAASSGHHGESLVFEWTAPPPGVVAWFACVASFGFFFLVASPMMVVWTLGPYWPLSPSSIAAAFA